MKKSTNKWLAVLGAAVVLAGCSGAPSRSDQEARVIPADVSDRFVEGLLLMQTESYAEAEEVFLGLTRRNGDYVGPWLNLGIIYARTGRNEQAETALRRALGIDAHNAVAHNELGILYRKGGRFVEANEAYGKAVEADPEYAIAYLNRGVLLDLYLRDSARALQAFERYQQLDGGDNAEVGRWITELQQRIRAEQRTAQVSQ